MPLICLQMFHACMDTLLLSLNAKTGFHLYILEPLVEEHALSEDISMTRMSKNDEGGLGKQEEVQCRETFSLSLE